jgi:hypothetical protein
MILLLQALALISNARDTKMILPIGFQPQINEQNEDRINDVYSYTMENFNQKIHTKQISKNPLHLTKQITYNKTNDNIQSHVGVYSPSKYQHGLCTRG